uniref:DM10 domain-containing protein n=1 Tax=Chromera velia CCMP2878 TaxID=1169474 RepID=A0A0G4FPB8_9ALVE|eukprot:Cvel_17968.t1-p1 / transcript=Cvel_17968.t1 / gene=Cvel_17968 / organism=Chromera_velia_CCMP2878 / gene_product=EF-hand domain-containing family member C2, putative / transcript_product=EF-hand domain-containing family member C2, putative / location=Cvel_scaffold1462:41639-43312(+) / protein_length=558 / sequence_SO=supercontig / SO=protein_coding / is_pseudo=false
MATAYMTHHERRTVQEALKNTYRPTDQPSWLKHDRQVLRFFGYFQEPVTECASENFRVRNCVFLFYLEDGTLQINEPKIENSGIPQGIFLKRHRVPRPDGNGASINIADLKMSTNITIYGRCFRLVDADEFTKWFCNEAGIDIGEPETTRPDNFFENALQQKSRIGAKKVLPAEVMDSKEFAEMAAGGSRRNVGLKQFLENDRRVLRFYCYWDDTARYGSRLYYTILFFLCDDTLQIIEQQARNCGRAPFKVFLRRMKLPKTPNVTHCPAMMENPPKYYKPEDLTIGTDIKVFSRDLHLYDCDDFTRDFFKAYAGIEQGKEPIPNPPLQVPRLSYPPHHGIGQPEDSLGSCLALVPKVPRVDTVKLHALSEVLMRFEARMIDGQKEDEPRRFIVGVRPADDRIGCWEKRQRNSGQVEGKFAELGRKKNPYTGNWYQCHEFYVGAVVYISSAAFLLMKCDEYSQKFFEKDPEWFPFANLQNVAARLKPAAVAMSGEGLSTVSPTALFQRALEGGLDVVEHDLVTLSRHASDGAATGLGLEELETAGVQLSLEKVVQLAG